MSSRLALAVCLLLVALPTRAASPEASGARLEVVSVRELPGSPPRALQLSFPPLAPRADLSRFSLQEALLFIGELESSFLAEQPSPLVASADFTPLTHPRLASLPERARTRYLSLYGASSLPLPTSLEHSRWFQALCLSPRFMPEGVREAALALFTSPATAYSLAFSLMLYMTAWVAPEPLFSKAFASAVTLGLLLTYSAAELHSVGIACWNLYQEAEASQTQAQLEAAAEHFGKALGGVGLRVLVTVAGAKLAKQLPEVPKGGLWSRLSPPRLSFPGGGGGGGFILGQGTRAQVSVANGTVVLMGVSANTTAAAVATAVASARASGDCRDASDKGEAQRHHIATDKNDLSETNGGPWTPQFKELFNRAGMSLDDPANIVYLIGHVGPHPKDYHQSISDRLEAALGRCGTPAECRTRITEELDKIAADICRSGSSLNSLLKRRP